MNKSIDTLTLHIKQWGEDRGIIANARPLGQAIKTLEETTELLDAINTNNSSLVADSIGDVFVTLVMVAETSGLDISECIDMAYEEIKCRKGYLTPEGVFIKEVEL